MMKRKMIQWIILATFCLLMVGYSAEQLQEAVMLLIIKMERFI